MYCTVADVRAAWLPPGRMPTADEADAAREAIGLAGQRIVEVLLESGQAPPYDRNQAKTLRRLNVEGAVAHLRDDEGLYAAWRDGLTVLALSDAAVDQIARKPKAAPKKKAPAKKRPAKKAAE